MLFGNVTWPGSLPSDLSALTKGACTATADVYFCSTCGATIFWAAKDQTVKDIVVATGVVENAKEVLRFVEHVYLGDTRDGGISDWVGSAGGERLVRWRENEDPEELEMGWSESGNENKGKSKEQKEVRAWCKCRGVQFTVTPPSKESGMLSPSISHHLSTFSCDEESSH